MFDLLYLLNFGFTCLIFFLIFSYLWLYPFLVCLKNFTAATLQARVAPCAGGDVLLFRLLPLFWGKRPGQCSRDCTMLISQVDQSTQMELLPALSMWRRMKTMVLTSFYGPESSHSSWRAPTVSQPSLFSLFLFSVLQLFIQPSVVSQA